MFEVSLYVHWHVYVFEKACTSLHNTAYYPQLFLYRLPLQNSPVIKSNVVVQVDCQNTFIYYFKRSKCHCTCTDTSTFSERLVHCHLGLPITVSVTEKCLTVECQVMCALLWASVHTKALHLSFLVKALETRLKWSKALEYKTGATLIKNCHV